MGPRRPSAEPVGTLLACLLLMLSLAACNPGQPELQPLDGPFGLVLLIRDLYTGFLHCQRADVLRYLIE